MREHRAPNLRRSEARKTPEVPAIIRAYDFETTRIKPGTPRPTYLTAYAQGQCPIHFAEPIRDMLHLHAVVVNNFLTDDCRGVKYVAWNANNFDTYFVAAALVTDERYVLRPYMTRSNSLRGLKVLDARDLNNPKAKGWEFLDGIAMLGLPGVSLETFLDNFAPDYKKLVGTIDFEKEEFDPTNSKHCEYAMRDSVGLWHGMVRAQAILMRQFNQPLRVTMGGACIRIFKRHIPPGVLVKTLQPELIRIIRTHVLRGGFCYCVRRYQGPIWKIDLNQAYAAAMREARLPCGDAYHDKGRLSPVAKFYVARLTATKSDNEVPFYYRTEVNGKLRSMFATTEIKDTWLTCIEVEQLRREGWQINAIDSWFWMDSFDMREYVDSLESVRMQCEGGPSGPIGTMLKGVGNHSYGKTLEQLDGNEFALSAKQPAGFVPHYPDSDDADPLPFVFVRALEPDEIRPKDYHQPQLGAWITAHVRMVVRRAALIDPDSWLYADTDCAVFSRDITQHLPTHPTKYGAWKIEESGTVFQIIAKKVYFDVVKGNSPNEKVRAKAGHAKGMNVKRLSAKDFAEWFDGEPPEQEQTQRQNFLRVMQGAEMYRRQVRSGTAVEKRIL